MIFGKYPRPLFVAMCLTLALPARAQEPAVARWAFTTAVRDREPVDRLERVPDGGATISFFTELVGLNGRRIQHVWLRDDVEIFRRGFDIGSTRWRAWSGTRVEPGASWSVRVEDARGTVLGTWRLGDAPPPRPEPPPPPPPTPPATPLADPVIEDVTIDVYRDLTYVAEGWPLGLSAAESRAGGLAGTPYEVLRREPRLDSPGVRYGYLPLGSGDDTRITFLVEDVTLPTWTIRVDRNNNEDLTDDGPPVGSEGTGRFSAKVAVEVEVADPGGAVSRHPYQVWVWFVESPDRDPSRAQPRFYARCHYAGKVRLGDETFDAVAYEERGQNGLFADDGVCIDLDRDGRCGAAEQVESGQIIQAGARRFRIIVRDR